MTGGGATRRSTARSRAGSQGSEGWAIELWSEVRSLALGPAVAAPPPIAAPTRRAALAPSAWGGRAYATIPVVTMLQCGRRYHAACSIQGQPPG